MATYHLHIVVRSLSDRLSVDLTKKRELSLK